MKKNDFDNDSNFLQIIFYALLKKKLPSWKLAAQFAVNNKISENTMKDAYYKNGKVGIQAMSSIIKHLIDLTPEKVDSIINAINKLDPIPDSMIMWNSIDVSEKEKQRLALYAKAISEIEKELEFN